MAVRLLLDENLSARLTRDLNNQFPGSTHVTSLGLGGASDRAIWERAAADDLLLVTKDDDFHRLSVLFGPPPKVIWIRLGNCTTADIAQLLRRRSEDIEVVADEPELAFLALG